MIRPMKQTDIADVMGIYFQSFLDVDNTQTISTMLSDPGNTKVVIVRGVRIIGYAIYRELLDEIKIAVINIDRTFRRKGHARVLIEDLKDSLGGERRRITAVMPTCDEHSILFFYKMGFRCTGIASGYFQNINEDGFFMEYQLPDEFVGEKIVNRIKRWVK